MSNLEELLPSALEFRELSEHTVDPTRLHTAVGSSAGHVDQASIDELHQVVFGDINRLPSVAIRLDEPLGQPQFGYLPRWNLKAFREQTEREKARFQVGVALGHNV